MKQPIAMLFSLLLIGGSLGSAVPHFQETMPFQKLSYGNTLYVGGDGPGNYSRIQDAVDAAADGDTVFVYGEGSPYNEHIIIGKSLTLLGEDKTTTILDRFQNERIITIIHDDVTVEGFTIQNSELAGIFVEGGYFHINIYNNIIKNNPSIGIQSEFGTYINISYNLIIDNNHGLSFWGKNSKIIGNTFVNNSLMIYESYNCNNEIRNNTLNGKPILYLENKADQVIEDAGAVILVNCINITVKNSHFSYGNVLLDHTNNCNIINNTFNTGGTSIYLHYSSTNRIKNNDIGGIIIVIWYSNYNIIENNIAHLIRIYEYSNNNTIANNSILGRIDICFSSDHNLFKNNTMNSVTNQWCNSNTFLDNEFNGYLRLDDSYNYIIKNNSFTNCGLSLKEDTHSNIVENNTVNNKPLEYYENSQDLILTDVGQAVLVDCENITIQNSTFNNLAYCIVLMRSNNCIILQNQMINCSSNAIYSYQSSNSNISLNNILGNEDNTSTGINIREGSFHSITNNFVNYLGITLTESSNSFIYLNTVINNQIEGIHLRHSDNNNVSFNTISYCGIGILLERSYNNTLYMNNISHCFTGIEIRNPEQSIIKGYLANDKDLNNIIKNNFRKNLFNGLSRFFLNFQKSNWRGNYWNRPRILPKIIFGFRMITEKFGIPTKLEFDMRPAFLPNRVPKTVVNLR